MAQEELAPWETVVVVPKSQKTPTRSKDVKVEYSKIEKVTVYIKSFCSDCNKVTDFLKDRGVKFEKQYGLLTLSGVPGIVLSREKPPITIIEYTDGTKRKLVGFDAAVLNTFFTGASGDASFPKDDFSISDFDLRGTKENKPQDSFDLR